jgi:4-alpha-glucanotransferase
VVTAAPEQVTHHFYVRSPLLLKGQVLCIAGSIPALGNWQTRQPLLLNREAGSDDWHLPVNLSNEDFPIAYKYGVYDTINELFLGFEEGRNRVVYSTPGPGKQTILNDGFTLSPADTWKGAGVAIPVFSLRTRNSMGGGAFTDLKLLTDWAVATGLQLIQILPVNDTTADYTWTDCYPYAAISAFALHPVYLDLYDMADAGNQQLLEAAAVTFEKERLETLDVMDYEGVIRLKMQLAKQLYDLQGAKTLATAGFTAFFEENEHWLVPYAAFCYLRDTYGTAQFSAWPEHSVYAEAVLATLSAQPGVKKIMECWYFIQYHLHLQLKDAAAYAHSRGVVLKGDIAIGIFRNSVDAWQQPAQYHMDMQAGAPPDDFAVKGQNWGFPTYNWGRMKQDGFAWWKQRLEQMGHYFDAFRIDHILGFFRIWSIPMHAVEGILGYFIPAIPVYRQEFYERDILFDHKRYTSPYITMPYLEELFGGQVQQVVFRFLVSEEGGHYSLQPAFATQQQVAQYFAAEEDNENTRQLRQGLYDLISNVILLEAAGSNGQEFHFRFDMQHTDSFRHLDGHTQYQLQRLYTNYFFERQDYFWKQEAMQKLPALKQVTNMLICGEDLGMVPASVPDVMQQLGLLSLEVQRMPKLPGAEFFHPANAPYLSVVTPSTHDMSTIRGWWEEDRVKTQQFYNHELQQWGEAPFFCEARINKAVVEQHLQSPAMWSIFQLQDLLGIDENIRRDNPYEERINVPANPKHYWRYRVHLSLESLLEADSFNTELEKMVKAAGR